MPAIPHVSGSSPSRAAYARIDASTARACLRRPSPAVNSVKIAHAASRENTLVDRIGRAFPERLDLAFEGPDAVEEMLDGLGHRVRQVGLVHVDLAGHPLAIPIGDLARHPDDHRARRDVAD